MGKIEVITSTERRRKWSDNEKRAIVEASYVPGVNVSALARKHKIEPAQIYTWRKDFKAVHSLVSVASNIPTEQPLVDENTLLMNRVIKLERIIAKMYIETQGYRLLE